MNLKKIAIATLVLMFAFTSSGCSICCSPYIEDYVAFGSRTPRIDMKNGRVGSILSDPQLMGNAYSTTTNGDEGYVDSMDEQVIEEDSVINDSFE